MVLSGSGLLGQYYDSADLSGVPALVRTDAGIDFDWATGSPHASLGADDFSVRWAGQIEANFTEQHTFIVNANDGARLWVNGQLLIDAFDANAVNEATANIDLIAGRRYDMQLEFREVNGDASVRLEWTGASTPRQVIPQSQLYASERGSVSVAQFESVVGGTIGDLVGDADFPDSPSSVSSLTEFATSSNVGDHFGRRVSGLLLAPATGRYQFYIAADHQAELWLSNTADSQQRIRIAQVTSAVTALDFTANAEQQSAPMQLVAGQKYFIEALHVDDTGADHLAVAWQRPGSPAIEVIPGAYLAPVLPTVRAYALQPVISEGAATPAQLTVVRSGGPLANSLDVAYDLAGSATSGVDFQSLSGTITIPAGQASATIHIEPLVDALEEGDEAVELTLRDGPGYEVGLKSERSVLVTLQDNRDVPAGGLSLWDGNALNNFQRFGGNFSTQNVPGMGDVIQVQIPSQPSSPFGVQLRQDIDSPVAEGDILYAEFFVRSLGGPGQIAAIFEDTTSFAKSLNQGLDVGPDWTRIQLPFTSIADYSIGQASFGFHLGFQAQTLQFANLQLLAFGPPRTLAPETAFNLNNISGTWGSAQQVSVTGQPFGFAFQVETETVPSQFWHLQAVERNEGPVNTGDTMRLSFYMRAVVGADPRAGLVVQRTNDFSTTFSQQITPTSEWQLHTFDIDSDRDYGPNGLQVAFNLGYGLQTIEIGGFHWENLNNLVDLEDLPRQVQAVSYGGRDGLDTWRTAANERIEALRKSSVTVRVVDNGDQPIDGAVVSLQQAEHGFRFGSAINAYNGKLDPGGNAQALKYQSEIKRLFNTVVAENSMKWPAFLGDRARALQLSDFAVENELYLRGHNVIWPSRGQMPASVWSEYDTRVASDGIASANAWLKSTIEARFDDVIDTFRGVVSEWDVVNEPFTNNDVMNILGDDVVIEWYQRFRDADPNMKLALNDYSIFTRNGGDTAHRQNFESWLQRLSNANLLDVIGIQSHYGETSLTDMDVLDQLITTYSTQYAAPIAITEFDVNTRDLQLQADYLRDFMTMTFSQAGVDQFLHWGFWQNSHWLPDAALYRTDFSIKPNGQAYEDLVFGNWWTDMYGTTRSGSLSTQAFIGQYDVLVQYDGKTYSANVEVDATGDSAVTVRLEDVRAPSLFLHVTDSQIDEADGAAATTVTVSRNRDLSTALVVTLTSSDTGEATVPANVTIPAGESAVVFVINAVDDQVVDGTQLVTLSAQAPARESAAEVIEVTDNDLPELRVEIKDTSINENGGVTQATVSRNTSTSAELIVSLATSDSGKATVPATVTIPSGSTSATFVISAVDDQIVGADVSVRVAASFASYRSESASVLVLEDDFWKWTNATNPFDVNEDGFVTPIDALLVINLLNTSGDAELPPLSEKPPFFYDVNGDLFATPIDALMIINELNSGNGEGESAQQRGLPDLLDTEFQRKRKLLATDIALAQLH